MQIKLIEQPKKIPLRCKNEFDMIIRFTKYDKWPKINKFLLSLGFLWTKIIILDHFNEPMSLWFKHRICNELIITSVI